MGLHADRDATSSPESCCSALLVLVVASWSFSAMAVDNQQSPEPPSYCATPLMANEFQSWSAHNGRISMARHMNRRKFLRAGGSATSIALISQPWIASVAFADYAVAPVKRRAVSGLAANDPILVGYIKAIAAMKALPATNPCSWTAQAAIHSPGSGPAGPCEHGNMFWSWHRMYLYWFERIVRHKSGMYDWSLPYWDYDWESPAPVSSAAQRQIPAPFRVTTSQLYDGTRNSGLNGGGSLGPGTTATATGLAPTSYMTAQSSINGTPHGAVHVAVGGNMSSFPTAGLDPLFWLHHCEIDRLWNLWLAKGGGRSNPLSDATWKTTKFTFYDECCEQVQMTGCEVLRAAQQLSYVYQVEPAQINQACLTVAFPWVFPDLIRTIRLERPLVLDREVVVLPLVALDDREFANRLVSLGKSQTETVILQLKNVEADQQPGAMWEAMSAFRPMRSGRPQALISLATSRCLAKECGGRATIRPSSCFRSTEHFVAYPLALRCKSRSCQRLAWWSTDVHSRRK